MHPTRQAIGSPHVDYSLTDEARQPADGFQQLCYRRLYYSTKAGRLHEQPRGRLLDYACSSQHNSSWSSRTVLQRVRCLYDSQERAASVQTSTYCRPHAYLVHACWTKIDRNVPP